MCTKILICVMEANIASEEAMLVISYKYHFCYNGFKFAANVLFLKPICVCS